MADLRLLSRDRAGVEIYSLVFLLSTTKRKRAVDEKGAYRRIEYLSPDRSTA